MTAKEVLYKHHYNKAISKGVSNNIAVIIAEALSKHPDTLAAMEEYMRIGVIEALNSYEEVVLKRGIINLKDEN